MIPFKLRAASQTAPINRVVPVAPMDDADLPNGPCRGLHVGAAGRVMVRDAYGGEVALTSSAGQYHPVVVVRVLASGTTADDIVALY